MLSFVTSTTLLFLLDWCCFSVDGPLRSSQWSDGDIDIDDDDNNNNNDDDEDLSSLTVHEGIL
jgi:hypothetical protein